MAATVLLNDSPWCATPSRMISAMPAHLTDMFRLAVAQSQSLVVLPRIPPELRPALNCWLSFMNTSMFVSKALFSGHSGSGRTRTTQSAFGSVVLFCDACNSSVRLRHRHLGTTFPGQARLPAIRSRFVKRGALYTKRYCCPCLDPYHGGQVWCEGLVPHC